MTISGNCFEPGARVEFQDLDLTQFAVEDATTIRLTTPPGAPGPVNVTVTNPGAEPATLAAGYTYIASAPSLPRFVSAVAGNARVTASWLDPESDGGSPVTGYTAKASPGGQTCSTVNLTCVITGLSNGTSYTVTVTAANTYGRSTTSQPSTAVTPRTVPSAPRDVSGVAGNARVVVSWLAPADDGGSAVTGYTVTASPGGQSCTTTGDLSCAVTGLTNGTAYTFTVTAANAAGDSVASQASSAVTPRTVPSAPRDASGVAGNGQMSVSWLAPESDGGSAVTGYTVTSAPEGRTCTTTGSLTCTVTGLTNGTAYTFTVTATNVAGSGAASQASGAVTPRTVPGAPSGVSGVAGNARVVVSWLAPASDGGSPVTGYTVTASPGGKTCATSGALTCAVPGLANGTAYTFTVTATNVAGSGAASGPSRAVTPVAPISKPGPVSKVKATAGKGLVRVTWSPPSNRGGAASVTYQYQVGTQAWKSTRSTSVTIRGKKGVRITVKVRAVNAAGFGPSVSVNGVPK